MSTAAAQPVTTSTTVIIHRVLAVYCLFNTVVALPALRDQWPAIAPWWLACFLPAYAVVLAVMTYRSLRRRPIDGWAGAYAVLTLLALLTGALAFDATPNAPWLWWLAGQSIVCAFVWRGAVPGLAYAVVIAVGWGALRMTPGFGAQGPGVAVSDAVFLFVATVVIGFTAIGMIRAGEAADALAGRVLARRVEETLQAAMGEERARLDRMIHDEVLAALASAAQADDAATERGARELARTSLTAIERLVVEPLPADLLSGDLLTRLAQESVQRVSPVVRFVDERPAGRAPVDVPADEADAMVSATREAVRNAVRHAGASTIVVAARQKTNGDGRSVTISFVVSDDGSGFALGDVPADRLGLRLSVIERMTSIGGSAVVASAPGRGTRVVLTRIFASTGRLLAADPLDPAEAGMPAAFPERTLIALIWSIMLAMFGLGISGIRAVTTPWPSLLAMALIALATAVLLRAGPGLLLPVPAMVVATGATVLAQCLMAVFLVRDAWPGYGLWSQFPVQVILVILVLRQRPRAAVLVWAVSLVALGSWALSTDFAGSALLSVAFPLTSFLVMGLFVNRGLLSISRRQHQLQVQEAVDLAGSVRRHVAQVQRSLWVSDLRATVRGVLTRIAAAGSPFGADLRRECSLLESGLRESLVARNLMSEQLSKLTEDARRRGVSLTFVDSRSTPAPSQISRAVLQEVQSVLARRSVSRVVVRLAPDRDDSASVVASDGVGTSITTIDQAGQRSTDL